MAIGAFANKTFTVSHNKVYTFDEFTRSGSLNVEEQEVDGKKPSLYIKGSSLEEVSFSIGLIAQKSVNVKNEIDSWISIMNAAKPYMLIIGNKAVSRNKYILIDVSISEAKFNTNGDYISAKLQLQFKEFVRYGKKSN